RTSTSTTTPTGRSRRPGNTSTTPTSSCGLRTPPSTSSTPRSRGTQATWGGRCSGPVPVRSTAFANTPERTSPQSSLPDGSEAKLSGGGGRDPDRTQPGPWSRPPLHHCGLRDRGRPGGGEHRLQVPAQHAAGFVLIAAGVPAYLFWGRLQRTALAATP